MTMLCSSKFRGESSVMVARFDVHFGDFSPYASTGYFSFHLGGLVAMYWERVAESAITVCSL